MKYQFLQNTHKMPYLFKIFFISYTCHCHIYVMFCFIDCCIKRKPPCIGGMVLLSLICNRVFISASSYGLGWYKIAIETKWYQFHTTDKCGILFILWITDQYTFGRYTKLANKIGIAVAKVIMFSIMTTWCNIHSVRHAAPPHPKQKLRAILHVKKWSGFPVISMCRSVRSKQVVCGGRPALC